MNRMSFLAALAVVAFTAGPRSAVAGSLDAIQAEESRVVFDLSAPAEYKAAFDAQGPRIIIDLHDTRNKFHGLARAKSGFVKSVAAAETGDRSNSTRVTIDLAKSAVFDVSWQGRAMIVWLGDFAADGTAPPIARSAAAPTPQPARQTLHKAPPAAPAEPERSSASRYMIQVAAFSAPRQAADLKETLELEPSFPPIVISTKEAAGKSLYMVKIGPLHERKEAGVILEKLARIGREAIVVREK